MCNGFRYVEREEEFTVGQILRTKRHFLVDKIHQIRYWKTGYLWRLVVLHFRAGDGRLMPGQIRPDSDGTYSL